MDEIKKYNYYRDINMKWVSEIPSHWKIERLKNLSNIQLSNIDKKTVDGQKEVLLCNYVDVYYNHTIDNKITFMRATAKQEQINRLELKKNDVLLTKDSETPNDIGVPSWVKYDLPGVVCGYHLAHIRPNHKKIDGRFLYYLLDSHGFRDHFWSHANGVTRFGISKGDIQDTIIFVPPIEEQISVAKYIDDTTSEIDSLISDKEKLIELLEEKRQAIITEAVTKGLNPEVKMKDSGVEWIGEIPEHWEKNKVKYSTYVKGRIGWQGLRSDEFIDEGPYLVTGTDFENGLINWETCYHISEERFNEAPAIQLKEDDLLITKDGTIGKIAIVRNKPEHAILNSGVFVTRCLNNQYLTEYMYWILSSEVFNKYIKYMETGSTIKHLYQETFVNFIYPLPNIIEQKEIVDYLNEKTNDIDSIIFGTKKQIEKIKEYRQSLIYEAVTGKIDVRNYKGE